LHPCEQTSKTTRKLDPAKANSGFRRNFPQLSESGPIHENRKAAARLRAEPICRRQGSHQPLASTTRIDKLASTPLKILGKQ
jgi:hypothetical protein